MKTIAVINQKGGVGKSTTVLSVGVGLTRKGYRVLLIDLDAQGNLSQTTSADTMRSSSMNVINGNTLAEDAIQHMGKQHIIASSPALAVADISINTTGKEYRLKEALETIADGYDYTLIDTPPALGILTINALTAANGCIIPAQADTYSLQGIKQLYATIQTVKKYCNASLTVMGILLTRYNGRVIIGREIAELLEQTANQFDTKLYKAKIRECTAIKESQAVYTNIFDYSPQSNAAMDYTELIDEILKED
jgi:chromosome partitioning protein